MTLKLGATLREVNAPKELAAALPRHVDNVREAKTDETRQRRITNAVTTQAPPLPDRISRGLSANPPLFARSLVERGCVRSGGGPA